MDKRTNLTPAQRSTPLNHTIDPGFVHHRKIQTILGPPGMEIIDNAIRALPDLPEWQKRVRIDHIYTQAMLIFCNQLGIKPLEEIVATTQGIGQLFCSTEQLGPCENIYEIERAISPWISRGEYSRRVEFHYSTSHVRADTLRERLHKGSLFSVIAELTHIDDEVIIFDPIVMGFPWLEAGDEKPDFDTMWCHFEFFEHFIEDFDEFQKIQSVPTPSDPEPMKTISEKAFKACLGEILGDAKQNDWGGEASDYYTCHLHLRGRRVTAAFLLKGPARFEPMRLNHLGKNNDQIVRLSHEPAEVLIVQHCHDILPPVRETLRAFAVQPSRARRYCLIDGRDSLRLLQAYGLYDKAVALSCKN